MADIIGKIHSIETGGTVDGPGIRYVVFTQGCPLRCIYCHNPDTWSVYGKEHEVMSASELVKDASKYRSYIKYSGGGITLTGGEPLMQKEFTAAFFEGCKEEGFHTALDTSGYDDPDELTDRILAHTDMVLLDVKSRNPETFKKIAGVSIDKTLRFAEYVKEKGIETRVRFVLIPGYTDSEDELHAMAEYVKTLANVKNVGVLPFHQLGAYKWDDLQLNYKLRGHREPTEAELESAKDVFRGYGLVVK
ncbi:MAG: pyruvate formate-lyase-activating protein [Defluviitaleaceae bacterium]|nr:pyruvate formate-lyase-activating protein [Defluviitaleaceae bacterium]